ncbi:hypothetical protein Noda2021_04750 [Candidatus Dependentiae bacterium Noda2021]|nr:hypothetical protein Noda2021_04750 [Candidatus Dependentiae bacterium Noda2021]
MKAGFSLIEYIIYLMVMSFAVVLSAQFVSQIHTAIKSSYKQINNTRAAAVLFQTLARDVFLTHLNNIALDANKLSLLCDNTRIVWYLKKGNVYRKIHDLNNQTHHTALVGKNLDRFTIVNTVVENKVTLKVKLRFSNIQHTYKRVMQSGWMSYS